MTSQACLSFAERNVLRRRKVRYSVVKRFLNDLVELRRGQSALLDFVRLMMSQQQRNKNKHALKYRDVSEDGDFVVSQRTLQRRRELLSQARRQYNERGIWFAKRLPQIRMIV